MARINPDPYDRHYDEEFEPGTAAKNLQASENEGGSGFGGNNETSDIDSLEAQGYAPDYIKHTNNYTGKNSKSSGNQSFLSRAKNFALDKKRGPSLIVVAGILGFLGFNMFSILPFGAIAAISNLHLDLDDVSPSARVRVNKIVGKKFIPTLNDPVSVWCAVPGSVKCKYSTMSQRSIDRLKRVGIEITGEPTGFMNRVRVTNVRYGGRDYTPSEVISAINDPSGRFRVDSFGAAWTRGTNIGWLAYNGPTFVRKALGRFGVSRTPPALQGNRQERALQLMARSGGGSLDDISFRPVMEDGNPVRGRVDADGNVVIDPNGEPLYVQDGDSSGKQYTESTKNRLEADVSKIKLANTPIARRAFQAASITGWADVTCEIVDTIGRASVAAKVLNSEQLAAYAMGKSAGDVLGVVPLVGKLKAGDITAEEAETLGEFFFATDSRETIKVVDTEGNLVDAPNPDYGKNALDSEPFKMSINGGTAGTSAASTKYSLGFGVNSAISGAARVASTASFLTTLPTVFGDINGCDFIQSGPVRVVSLGVGIFGAFLTGGASALANVAKTIPMMAISYTVTNWFNSYLSMDLITEDLVDAPVERGTAVWTGMAAIHSQSAQARGMIPGTAEALAAYQVERNRYRQDYIAFERQESDPFDIKNPYSVTGSIANSITTHLPTTALNLNLSSAATGLSSFVFGGLTSTLKPHSTYAQSFDSERFQQCDDIGYRNIGIDADVQCNVRFYMPQHILDKDPIEVAQWMEDEGYVEEDTTTGLPKGYTPKDQGQDHSLARQIIMGQVNSIVNTRKYADEKKAEIYGKFLDFCVNRTLPFGETYEDGQTAFGSAGPEWHSGEKCLETGGDESCDCDGYILDHFRAYVFDQSVSEDLDEAPVRSEGGRGRGGGARLSESQLLELIKEYGLPDPTAEGVDGWEQKLSQLTDNPKASWAAESLLAAEKNFMDRGGDLKEYLTTAWIWFENGGSTWPDPYQINCDDDRGFNHEVSELCTPHNDVNLQVSGYRPVEKQDKYMEIYDMFYTESELPSILEKVRSNSHNARLEKWNYNDPDQRGKGLVKDHLRDISGATTSQITPNATDFFNPETQFLTLMLGKDPNMTIGMNSFAVSDHDLLAHIGEGEGCGPSWGSYICKPERQLLSNMIYALWKYDSQFGGPEGGRGGGTGVESIWGGGHMELGQEWGVTNFSGTGYYDNYAGSLGVPGAHPGLDYSTPDGTRLYTPVSGKVMAAGGTCYFRDDRYTKSDASCENDSNLRSDPGTGEFKIEFTVNGETHQLILGHMSKIEVDVGETLSAGDYIGLSGNSNGDHVHVEYRIPGNTSSGQQAVDPRKYL